MLETLRAAWKVEDLRRRIFFTLLMLVVFRLGSHIPVPGVDSAIVQAKLQAGALFGLLNLFSGGAFFSFSVFAMTITPYINAAIIMQLLTVAVPFLEQLAKEGEEGRKKMIQYTRYLTVILAVVEAVGITFGLTRIAGAFYHPGLFEFALTVITLTAGTIFLMWVGEMITDQGIGNGISLLIFAGIVSQLPLGVSNIVTYLQAGTINFLNIILLLVVALAVVGLVVVVQEGRRHIPVSYAKRVVGRKVYGGRSTYIPMQVNGAGVIPIIFAISILAFPLTLAHFITAPWATSIVNFMNFTTAPYIIIEFILVFAFTFFYTAVTFNPKDVAENLQKYGGFIPGLRPGKPTQTHLERILTRLTVVGAVFLAAVAIMPNFITMLTNIPNIYFGGTSLLILVGVALETMKQIEAHLTMRSYQGFMR